MKQTELWGCRGSRILGFMTKNVMDSRKTHDDTDEPAVVPVDNPNEPFRRQQVADVLGVSVSEVRRLERTGAIRPKKRNPQGVWLFDQAEVRAVAEARRPASGLTRKPLEPYTTEQAKAVFVALDAGKTLIQCVLECDLMPRIVETIALDYARLSGAMFIRKETMDTINGLALEGSFPLKGDEELLEMLQAAAEESCRACSSRPRSLCKPCALKLSVKAREAL